jgi:hypothetical protein
MNPHITLSITLLIGCQSTTKEINLKSIIHRAYYLPPMQSKLQKDNNWTTAIFESIDWASFQSAMSSLPICERISICKLTNGLWNTNSQNQRYYGTLDACPFCTSKETVAHVYSCPSQKCIQHCLEALKDFHLQLTKSNTAPAILNTITYGLQQWVGTQMEDSPEISAPTIGRLGTLDVLLTKAFTDQTRDIGWLPFLQGKLSKYWKAAHQKSLPRGPSASELTNRWGKKLVLALWTMSKSIWEHRNKEIHGQSLQEAKLKTRGRLEKEILHLYQKYNDNPHIIRQIHRHLFDRTSDTLCASSVDTQAAWVRSVKEAILARKHYDSNAANRQKTQFRQFFIPKGHNQQSNPLPPPSIPSLLHQPSSTRHPDTPLNSLTQLDRAGPPVAKTTNVMMPSHKFSQNPQSLPPTPSLKLVKVKGRKRLYKYQPVGTTRKNQHHLPGKSTLHSIPTVVTPSLGEQVKPTVSVTLRSSDEDILLRGSGLSFALPRRGKRRRSPATGCKSRTNQKTTSRRGPRPLQFRRRYPMYRGQLEAFGFKVRGPKSGQLIQELTRRAEENKSDYSGTYVSTVP